MKRFFSLVGSGGRAFVALVGICGITAAFANYALTQGSGTNFGSIVVSTVHYAQQLICDATTPSQCGAVTATGGQIVDVATSNNQLHTDLTSAVPAGANLIGKVGIDQTTPGTTNLVQSSQDPCTFAAKTNLPISFQTTSITQQIALSGSTKIYVCSLSLIASVATVFSITGGTGTNCGTPAALIGTTSATHGLSLAANGGLTLGNGAGTIAVTGAGSELCMVQSGAGDLVGNLTYVQQ